MAQMQLGLLKLMHRHTAAQTCDWAFINCMNMSALGVATEHDAAIRLQHGDGHKGLGQQSLHVNPHREPVSQSCTL